MRPALLLLMLLVWASPGCQVEITGAEPSEAQETKEPAQSEPALVILNDSELPDTFPHALYDIQFHARGGVPTHHWRVEKGSLPPGIVLEDSGRLHGQAERAGEFQFTVSVRDGSQPPQAVQKGFTLRVKSALSLTWKTPAHVNGNRIEGSVEVANVTPDNMDLTFIVLAVAGNGRATAIGYQHFVLKRATVGMELPFGETLPHGSYVVHVDAVGEVAAKNLIYRDRMQTPVPLQVTVGP
jgi:putative Ig domain-containing protein